MRYEQKAYITVEADNLEGAKQELDRIQRATEDAAGLLSFEGDPEEVEDYD
jgi:hypothetical protein